nr:MFS transporter [Paenibacillus phyllosphaerae]
MWQMTLFVVFLNATTGMVDTTVIYYAKDSLRLGNGELGLALSAAGSGGLLGSFMISPLRRRYRLGVILTVTTLLTGIAYLLMIAGRHPVTLAAGLFLEGLLGAISTVCVWTYRQETTPHRLIGRINGITGSAFKLAMPAAIFAAGWMSQLAQSEWVFIAAAFANVILFLVCRFGNLWRI